MTKLMCFLHRLYTGTIRLSTSKKAVLTSRKLHKNLKKIQAGHTVQADVHEMRMMSKMLHKEKYGTTTHPTDPLKLDLTAPLKSKVCNHDAATPAPKNLER